MVGHFSVEGSLESHEFLLENVSPVECTQCCMDIEEVTVQLDTAPKVLILHFQRYHHELKIVSLAQNIDVKF